MLTGSGSIVSGTGLCLSTAKFGNDPSAFARGDALNDNKKLCPSLQKDYTSPRNSGEKKISSHTFGVPEKTRMEPKLVELSHQPWIAPLNFSDARLEHPAPLAELQSSVQSSSQLNLLPSPFTVSPTTPTQPLPLVNYSFLKRNDIAATTVSSIYSRSTSASSILSCQFNSSSSKSSLNSTSKSIICGPSSLSIPSRLPKSKDQAAALQLNHMLRGGGKPIRPGSTPSMPPSAFWLYARAVQQRCNAIQELESATDPETRTPSVAAIPLPDVQTMSISHPPSINPSPYWESRGSSSHKHRNRQVAQRGSYERLRKDGGPVQRPPKWTGKEGLDRRLAAHVRDPTQVLREDREEGKAGRKLVKKRQP